MAAIFRKILCAVDFDRNSMATLDFAGSLAKQNNASLHGLYVVPVPMRGLGYAGEPYKRLGQVEQQNLQTLLNAHVPAEVRYESIVRVGNPAQQILMAADKLEVDLIVMATHGRGGLSRAIFGSVAEGVLRRSHRPVLIVKPGSLSAALALGTL